MQTKELAISTGSAIKANPIAMFKVFLFIVLALVVLVVVYKFLKGFGRVGDLLGDLGPSTEEEKRDVIGDPNYQSALKYLGDQQGIFDIVKAGYKTPSNYMLKKSIPDSLLNKAADQIWSAKVPGYIDETDVYNAIASLPSKAAISLMAGRFNYVNKDRLGFYPLNVFLSKYLKLKEMQTLTQIINKKPTL